MLSLFISSINILKNIGRNNFSILLTYSIDNCALPKCLYFFGLVSISERISFSFFKNCLIFLNVLVISSYL